VANTTLGTLLDVEGVTWNHWSDSSDQPQSWTCSDQSYMSCTCSGPSCRDGGGLEPLQDGADTVSLASAAGFSFDGGAALVGSCH
jgi:hypothetical protein